MKFFAILSKGFALTVLALPLASANDAIIFDAEFNKQSNWTPQVRSQRYLYDGDPGDIPNAAEDKPGKFDFYYFSEAWHPSEYPDSEPVAQITDDFPGSDGNRAFVMFDESRGGPSAWGADSVMTKDLGAEYDELYVETRIKFSPEWVWEDVKKGKGQSAMKLLRCRRHSGITTDNRFSFYGADARSGSPVAIFDLKSWTTKSGNYVRPLVALRGYTDPKYHKTADDYYHFNGQYDTKIESGVEINGSNASWQDVFLDGQWHTVGMYLKMDSQAGAEDGEVRIFIDGQPVIQADDVPWRRAGDDSITGWNECSVGGNINNVPYDASMRHEQWYAIDTFRIYEGMPNRPSPPSSIKIVD